MSGLATTTWVGRFTRPPASKTEPKPKAKPHFGKNRSVLTLALTLSVIFIVGKSGSLHPAERA